MHDIDRTQMEFTPEMESFEYEAESESEGVFNEAEEMELASELMGVSSEAELEQFLGDLIKKAGSAIGSFVQSPTGKAIGGYLKGAAKKYLPTVGSAVGGWLGGSTGADIGGKLGSFASSKLELEAEDEMETAKQFVRMAGEAVKNVVTAPTSPNVQKAAAAAISQAAKAVAPGLLAKVGGGTSTGRWIRRGNRIIVIGV
jgi:phage tail tape-measure protein